jgi:Archaeal fructose-1,6-bisphosphatase and related enzymes of inositol monophosphatase family
MNFKNYLDIAKEAAKEAGNFLIKNKLSKKEVYSEVGRDIKLELDRETEDLIRKKLESTNIPVLGEEFGGEESPE